MTKFLLGADPELFIRNANTGSFVSAHGKVPGTKQAPHKVEYGAVQIDGTALEFNIDPTSTVEEFQRNITQVRATITAMVPGYNVVAEPTALYDKEYFDWEVPATAKELGCDPDFNAYTLETNVRPEPGDRPMRTGAGHIHIGWGEGFDAFDKEHFEKCARLTRQLDYYLGIYSLQWDADASRRELYGKAGAFRPKSYGVEYRVLSNRWLSSDALIRWVYKQTIAACEAAEANRFAETVWDKTAQNIINSNMADWRDHYPIELGVSSPPALVA